MIFVITLDVRDSIPIVYYGQEQYSNGNADPVMLFHQFSRARAYCFLQYNRAPLWPTNYANTTAYQLITALNKVLLMVSFFLAKYNSTCTSSVTS